MIDPISVKFSIIIPTCHRNDLLAKCLQKLSLNKPSAPEQFEVIVTDDGKNSTAEKMINDKFPWVRWIKGKNEGPAANRNNGAKVAAGSWLIFTDDDCLPDPWWVGEYIKAVENNSLVKVFEGKTYASRAMRAFNEVAPVNEEGGIMPSCNLMIFKDTFKELGGFDEDYSFSFEDVDFHYRIKKNGYDISFVPKASVFHPWRKVDKKLSAIYFQNQIFGLKMFIKKHPEIIKIMGPKHFLHSAFIALYTFPRKFIKFKGKGVLYAFYDFRFKFQISIFLIPNTINFFFHKNTEYFKRRLKLISR